MNNAKAIKLPHREENPELLAAYVGNMERLEQELKWMAQRQLKFVVSTPQYSKFNREQPKNIELLVHLPDLQTAYLDEEPPHPTLT